MGAEPACTEIDAASANGTDSGLDGVRAVAVSPDGKSLYAVAPEDDAVAVFDRDPATGILTYQGCLTGETQSGNAACTAIPSATDNGIDSGLDMQGLQRAGDRGRTGNLLITKGPRRLPGGSGR